MVPRAILLFALAGLISALSPEMQNIDRLERTFTLPPDDCRIMMRWWWFGPAVTKSGLAREMSLMKEGGIGGFEVQPTYPLALDGRIPGLRNLKFLSSEHLEALAFTAAKAKELGLRMDLTLGSGWPYGGPPFQAREGAGRLHLQAIRVEAGQNSVPVPSMAEGETLLAAFIGPRASFQDGGNPFKELEIRDGAALIPAHANDLAEAGFAETSQVLFFIGGRTGMKVKRAAYGAEGYVIDHYDPAVIDKFIKEIAAPAVEACGPNPPTAVFCDSLEVGGEDWTDRFLDEFKSRRGYDLRPFLPALFRSIGPETLDIRHDWGKTLTELFNENFNSALQAWAKSRRTLFRIQGYGTPPAALHSYAFADICEGEGASWKNFSETRWASSASHLLGRAATSSETWTWLHSPVFRASPLDMKAEADLHFLQGINQLIGHGWPYTAEGVEDPGWRFYAAGVFNDRNPWWIVMPDVTKYLQRISAMMRQGAPANDVALYLSNSDAWAHFTPGRVELSAVLSQGLGEEIIPRILEAGYNFDFFDDELLASRGLVENGMLAFGDARYKVVVLAGVERIPPPTMRKLEDFVRSGGILIATRSLPSRAPGFKATAEDDAMISAAARRLFQGPGGRAIFMEAEARFGEMLAGRLSPDVRFAPAAPAIGFVHRRLGEGPDVYFLANTGNERSSVRATFRIKGLNAESWDPLTGHIEPLKVVGRTDGGTTVDLAFEPYGSRLVVFTMRNEAVDRAEETAGAVPPAIDLSRGWNVIFGGSAGPVLMETLRSWTDDETTRFFSGTASYEKEVNVPEGWTSDELRVWLDFGDGRAAAADGRKLFQALLEAPVREAAVVYVNDKRAGSVWCPPYRIDITGWLVKGRNRIRITTANLAINAMAARPLPDYRELNARFGERFQPQDMDQVKPVTAGLIGSIRLVAERRAKESGRSGT